MEGLVVYGLVIVFTITFVAWGRRVWRKHEEENIYEPDPRAESHKKDPFFLQHFLGGGSGPR